MTRNNDQWHEEYREVSSNSFLGRITRFFQPKPKSEKFKLPDLPANIDSIKKASLIAERELLRLLHWRRGHLFDDVTYTSNILYKNSNFEIDALVFKQGVGLILIEAKHYSGDVYASAQDKWKREQRNELIDCDNACLQVLRTKRLLKQLLSDHDCADLPIHPIVIFTNDQMRLFSQRDEDAPQTLVMTQYAFLKQLHRLKINKTLQFEPEKIDQIKSVLRKYEADYVG